MKRQILINTKWVTRLTAILCSVLSLAGCTKNFEKLNTNPMGLADLTAPDVRSLFPGAEFAALGGGGSYETTTMLFAGTYSQHFAATQPLQESHRYVIVQRWMDIWPGTYVSAMPKLVNIINATKGNAPTLNAVARIWKVFAMHRLTDYFGPVPYSKIGLDSNVVSYDPQKDIYFDFFKELDEATTDLKNNISVVSFATKDFIYGGDNTKWLVFANTLRLRLALRISKVEPAKAKVEAEKAVAAGVMTVLGDGAYFKTNTDFPNGLNFHIGRNNSRMSCSMESLLKGWNDPRLATYFSPAVRDGLFHGVRNGMSVAEQNLAVNSVDANSTVSPKYLPPNMYTTPQVCMYASEAYFLRAEGALNGWDMKSTAQDLYERGITISMNEHEVTDATAISNYIKGTSLPMAPEGYFNTPALTNIPVKFSADAEKQREQIGTQKWLCLYPESHEAWAEIRRSGYPKFYPILHSQNPDITPDKMIRRISFLDREKIANGPAVKAAVPLLGKGADNVATPLWWDTH
ncbi:MAG: SusD/RagB family nutrient-binding outer membrane lipoprotein [Chitinophagaceae bacterium]